MGVSCNADTTPVYLGHRAAYKPESLKLCWIVVSLCFEPMCLRA